MSNKPNKRKEVANPVNFAAEIRKQKRLDRMEIASPRCVHCGENDDRCLEAHHIAGRKFDPATAIECRNCHRKLSDMQRDHPEPIANPPGLVERVAHFLLGLADLFELLIQKFREFADDLLKSRRQAADGEDF